VRPAMSASLAPRYGGDLPSVSAVAVSLAVSLAISLHIETPVCAPTRATVAETRKRGASLDAAVPCPGAYRHARGPTRGVVVLGVVATVAVVAMEAEAVVAAVVVVAAVGVVVVVMVVSVGEAVGKKSGCAPQLARHVAGVGAVLSTRGTWPIPNLSSASAPHGGLIVRPQRSGRLHEVMHHLDYLQ